MELCLDILILHNKCRRTIALLEGMNIVAAPSNLVWTMYNLLVLILKKKLKLFLLPFEKE